MKFEPKTEKQLLEEGLWPEGIYDFEILNAMRWISKGNKESIRINLLISNPDGRKRGIFDYLTANNSYGQIKLLHLAHACGLDHQYSQGEIQASDFIDGTKGRLHLIIQKSEDPKFSDKNTVKDYLCDDDENISFEFEEDSIDEDSLSF